MSATIYATPVKATVQFGNPEDRRGYRVIEAEVVGVRKDMCGHTYLVRDGKTYGIADFNTAKNQYHCTKAMTLNGYFMDSAFTAGELSRHLGFSSEAFV